MKSAMNYIGALFVLAAAGGLGGCGVSMYSSAGAAVHDDLYGTHDIRGLAVSERQEAELRKALTEAREAQFRAEAAEYEARMRLNSEVLYERDGSYVLESTYEGAYARRLRGFEDEKYRPASGYQLGEIYRYDPVNYNLMVSGNQVWVEPKYITTFFGTWGAESVGLRLVNSRYGNPYLYRDYWGYGWYPPYVGWDSYYVWNYPLGWGYPWWSDPFYYGYGWSYGTWGWHYSHHWNTWPHGGGSWPGYWEPAHSNPRSYRDRYGSAPNRPSYSTPSRPGSSSGSQGTSSRPGSYSSPSYRQRGSSTGSSSRSTSTVTTPSSVSRSNASSGSSGSTTTGSSRSTSTTTSRNSGSSSSDNSSSYNSSSSFDGGSSSSSSGSSSYSGGSSSRSGGGSSGSRSR